MGFLRALAIAVLLLPAPAGRAGPDDGEQPARTPFDFPCEGYVRGLRGKGNFGVLVTARGSPFTGSYHLAEDVWLPPGTEVRSVADGVVRYSDFSPTRTDDRGQVHWNLGNVIVIEHPLAPAEDGLAAVCSFYVHLASDRKVKVRDVVRRGQAIGAIGADRSEENGRYPAHLHFGLHRGPYLQIPPAWKRGLVEEARTTGIRLGPDHVLKGEIVIERHGETDVLISTKDGKESMVLSLLVGSTSPGYKPKDIMGWCEGYGDRATVEEWLRPSVWIQGHRGKD